MPPSGQQKGTRPYLPNDDMLTQEPAVPRVLDRVMLSAGCNVMDPLCTSGRPDPLTQAAPNPAPEVRAQCSDEMMLQG